MFKNIKSIYELPAMVCDSFFFDDLCNSYIFIHSNFYDDYPVTFDWLAIKIIEDQSWIFKEILKECCNVKPNAIKRFHLG